MFDIFYIGKKPKNLLLPCKQIASVDDAYLKCRTRYFWLLHYLCDYTDFDFLWEPKPWEHNQKHAFRSQWQQDSETYLIPKKNFNGEINYHDDIIVNRLPDLTNWTIPVNIDDSNFNYSWHPDVTEPPYIYQFGTQWQKTGGPVYTVPTATTIKYTSQIKVDNITVANDEVYLIDHGNLECDDVEKQLRQQHGVNITKRTRFIDSYLGTLTRIISRAKNDYVWVCSSICDYSNFDFSWHPEKWQGTMLHVFPSDGEKFGDTFLINVASFNKRIKNTELLEWYDTINFVNKINVPRYEIPKVPYESDDLVKVIKQHNFKSPYALFYPLNEDITEVKVVPVYWREKTRKIHSYTKSGSVVAVPRDVIQYIKKQCYDYPYIFKHKEEYINEQLPDVIFLSNGEPMAEDNWKNLKRICPRAKRSDGILGREKAYKTAAMLSILYGFIWFLLRQKYLILLNSITSRIDYNILNIIYFTAETH